jgi:hypothetical protein
MAKKKAKSTRAKAAPTSKVTPRKKVAAAKQPSFSDMLANFAPAVQQAADQLRQIVFAHLNGAEEGIYGGSKVRIALYSLGGSARVVCGIQPSGSRCLLYLHRIQPQDAPQLDFQGQGKHALHLEFASGESIPQAELARLLQLSASRLSDRPRLTDLGSG